MDRNSVLQALVWAVSFIGLLLAYILVSMWLTGNGFGESVKTFQAIITSVAIAIAAAFAVFKLQIFRVFAPHLTITQEVAHRLIGESYVHIDVSASLRNSSRVKIELQKGFFLLQLIAPLEDQEIETLYSQVFVAEEIEDFAWPKLYEINREWEESALIIEPGESHQEVCEFVVTSSVKSVLVYAFFHNPYSSAPGGWGVTTIHYIA